MTFEIWQCEEFDGGIGGYQPERTWRNVWTSSLTVEEGVAEKDVLEILFASFQRVDRFHRTPDGYAGRSLTSGDVVKLADRWYFCAFVGWEELDAAVAPEERATA